MSDDKKLSLIDQSKEIMNIIQELEASGDEAGYDEALQEKLVAYLDKQAVKVDSYGHFYKELSLKIELIDQQIEQLAKFQARAKSVQERMKGAALIALDLSGQKKLTGFLGHSLSKRQSKSVKILDMDALPEKYVKVKIDSVPDKAAIKKALDSGEDVPGVEIQVNDYVVID